MPYADRDKQLAYLREYRRKNEDVRSRTEYQRKRRDGLRALLREIKKAPCLDCGGTFHHSAMDFDHRPDEAKTWDISRLVARNASVSALMAEVAKCDLVCANCHRVRSWSRDHDADGNPTPTCGFNEAANATAAAARARRRRAKDDRALAVKAKLGL